MATDNVTIIRVNTGEAVKSVNDLKENVKILKANLGTLQIGTTEYQDTLEELKINQNALKDAMYATSSSLEDVQKSAMGANTAFDAQNNLVNKETISYNELVHTMANLKEAWRSTTDATERAKIGERINSVNNRLKDLDKSIGNSQRNVGNYSSAFDGLSGAFTATAGSASSVINPIKNVNAGLKAMSATPVIGVLGLLANILSQVIGNLKTSEENIRSASVAMSALSAISDIATKTMQILGSAVAKVADVLGNLAKDVIPALKEASELRMSITEEEIRLENKRRETIKRNADDELAVAQLRAKSADRSKYSAQERLNFLEEANKRELAISSRNREIALMEYNLAVLRSETTQNSTEDNNKLAESYANMQRSETAYFNKQRELNSAMSKARKEIANENKKAVFAEQENKNELVAIDERWLEKTDINIQKQIDEQNLLAQTQKEIDAEIIAETESTASEINSILEALDAEEERRKERNKERAKERIDTMIGVADATASVFGSLADIYEADEENSKKNATKIKALRIAEATINTINGAITAFMANASRPIIAAAQATAVTAAGMANIAKIRNTNIGGEDTGATRDASFSSASVSAPRIDTSVSQVRNITSASEEERLNQMASDQRVYILASDIQASNNQIKTQVAESSF